MRFWCDAQGRSEADSATGLRRQPFKAGTSMVFALDLSRMLEKDRAHPEVVALQVVQVLARRLNPQGLKNIKIQVAGPDLSIEVRSPAANAATAARSRRR